MQFKDLIIGQTFAFQYELDAFKDAQERNELKWLGKLLPAILIYQKLGNNSYRPVQILHRIRGSFKWTERFRGVCYSELEVVTIE